jgi:hypothetical protein
MLRMIKLLRGGSKNVFAAHELSVPEENNKPGPGVLSDWLVSSNHNSIVTVLLLLLLSLIVLVLQRITVDRHQATYCINSYIKPVCRLVVL